MALKKVEINLLVTQSVDQKDADNYLDHTLEEDFEGDLEDYDFTFDELFSDLDDIWFESSYLDSYDEETDEMTENHEQFEENIKLLKINSSDQKITREISIVINFDTINLEDFLEKLKDEEILVNDNFTPWRITTYWMQGLSESLPVGDEKRISYQSVDVEGAITIDGKRFSS